MTIPRASVAPELSTGIELVALAWFASPDRPKVAQSVAAHWSRVLAQWLEDGSVPLLVRKAGPRGTIVHHQSGRPVVPVDNAPANWVLSSALSNRMPSLPEIMQALESGELPVGFALTAIERTTANFRGTQRIVMDPPNLNSLGWTVCDIEPVGLGTRQPLHEVAIDHLLNHMRRFLSVDNMFVVPTSHAGLGELPEFLNAFRQIGGS
jgi:hypothetical protein